MASFLRKRKPGNLRSVNDDRNTGANASSTGSVRIQAPAGSNAQAASAYRSAVMPRTNGGAPYAAASSVPAASAQSGGVGRSESSRYGYEAGRRTKAAKSEPSEGSRYAPGGFEEAYNRIVAILNGYGIPMELPTYDELYAQLEALLRPSVDAAIDQRQKYGESALAELDADAYSRGMGGSSYLSSMKNREYDSIASDIARLEAGYTSDLADYLYNATYELNRLQAQFAAMFLQNEFDKQAAQAKASAGSSGSGSSGRGSGSYGSGGSKNSGNKEDSESGSSYEDYTSYMEYLSEDERYDLFHSNDEYWAEIRREMQEALSEEDYLRLRERYDTGSGSGSGGSSDNGGGHSGGENLWQPILY